MTILKLISLNIEGEEHLEVQKRFFEKERPDIICLQEVFENTYLDLKGRLRMHGKFAPMWKRPLKDCGETTYGVMGIALLSRYPFTCNAYYYHGNADAIVDFIPEATDQNLVSRVILVGSLEDPNNAFTIGTTHFTWSRDGRASNQQLKDLKALLAILEKFPDIVFCGDFNAPRGGKIFDKIARRYKDSIPCKYKTSIDGSLHYAGNLEVMVDGIFTTPNYTINGVELIGRVSDHYAVKAYVAIGG